MEKAINDYQQYSKNRYKIWKERFVWLKGGKDPHNTIGIMRFIKDTNEIENVIESGVPTNSNDLFNTVDRMANKYVDWVRTTQGAVQDYSDKEYNDMHNHFVGALGEYFFVHLLTEVRCVQSYNQNKEYTRYDFHYTSLYNGRDFGIDLTSVVSSNVCDMSCALQVKFWNPFINDKEHRIDITVFQKLGFEAYRNGYADPQKNHNLFLCWLGDETAIYNDSAISTNTPLMNAITVIGKRSLDMTINNHNHLFWQSLFKSLVDFKSQD